MPVTDESNVLEGLSFVTPNGGKGALCSHISQHMVKSLSELEKSHSWRFGPQRSEIFSRVAELRTTINSIGQNNRIYINGGGIYHQGNIAIKGNNNKVFVNKDCSLSNLNITIIGNDCIIEIGAGTTTNGTHMYCIGERHVIRVGKDCMFACGTELWTSDSHSILSIESGEAINIRKHDVVIGDHVWLAEYSKVLKRVTVADNCVIGMCAVLTKSTFPNSLYVGVPANMIKQGITWKR